MNESVTVAELAGKAIAEIESNFKMNGWNLRAAVKAVDNFHKVRGWRSFDLSRDSVHSLILAAVLLNGGVKRILELGTFAGETTALMASLAPDAEIVTVDLPDDDPVQVEYVTRSKADPESFLRIRGVNLAASGIKFIQSDTFLLSPRDLGLFDLVWVDAWHLFPNVAWDTYLAYHVCQPGGLILCDDIEINERPENQRGGSDGYRVTTYLEGLGLSPQLFMKRIAPAYLQNDRRDCKYVAAITRGEQAATPMLERTI